MNLKKIKNKVLSFSITSALISSITAINAYAADNDAGVDISGGINKAINEVKVQFKDVVAVIFGFLTLVALTVAVAKLVKGLLSHRNSMGRNRNGIWCYYCLWRGCRSRLLWLVWFKLKGAAYDRFFTFNPC